jgi:hypothetical protein
MSKENSLDNRIIKTDKALNLESVDLNSVNCHFCGSDDTFIQDEKLLEFESNKCFIILAHRCRKCGKMSKSKTLFNFKIEKHETENFYLV